MELLLDTLKWSAVIGAAALGLTALKPLLDKRYSPKWRYGAWLVLAALLLLAPVQWERLLPKAPAPAVVIEVPRMEVSLSREEGVSLQAPAALPGAAAGSAAQKAPARVLELDRVLTALWIAGAAVFVLYHVLGTALLQRRARRWSRAPGAETARICAEVRQEMGLRKGPQVRIGPRGDSPMLVGLLRPCLLLPGEDFSQRELRFILRHELTHWRRRDLWYKLLVMAANAVHWFNPLVYLMSREASRDIELTCDALVVAGAGPEVRRAYSETLLASIHRQKGFSGRSALTTHFYGGAEVMKERFRHILGRQGRKWGGIVLALTLLVTVVTACAVGVRQKEDSGEPEQKAGQADPAEPADQAEPTAPDGPADPSDTADPADPAAPEEPATPDQGSAGDPSDDPLGPGLFAGELTAEELEAFAAWFNPTIDGFPADTPDIAARNGLLRFPFESFEDIRPFAEILFYDAGEYVSDEAERAALEERMGTEIDTDCCRLTRDYIREFLSWYLVPAPTEEEITRFLEEDVSLPNLAEYDAFYVVKGDTMMQVYEFDRGVREADGTVKLYYHQPSLITSGQWDFLWDQDMCVTMRLTGNDVWGVVSNTIVE